MNPSHSYTPNNSLSYTLSPSSSVSSNDSFSSTHILQFVQVRISGCSRSEVGQ